MRFIVNNVDWLLVFVDKYSDNLKRSDGSFTLGVCDNNTKTVYIYSGLSDAMTDKVFCHELVHVFSFEHSLNIDIETEEIIADFMSLYGREIIYLADDILQDVLDFVA